MSGYLKNYIFTSESVGIGHPDKIADQISDAILDEYLKEDPYSRAAIETLVTTNRVVIAGEVRGPEKVMKNVEQIARSTIKNIGYEQDGFHWQRARLENLLHAQSADIARGVDSADKSQEGAGDQGIMFGFACDETEDLMPAAIYYSHKILKTIADAIAKKEIPNLGPDAKSQVTLQYENTAPVRADSIVVSIQHPASISVAQVREFITPYIKKALPDGWMCEDKKLYVNPTGQFIIGGPDSDTGLTGRKIIVDSYGGAAPHGGGAFSGKDPTKVDRSAAYIARYLAKNVVAAKISSKCTIQIAYAIGVAKPLALYVNLHSVGTKSEEEVAKKLTQLVDLSPWGIRSHLDLHRPIYLRTAAYGHFGRKPDADGGFSWEKTDLANSL